MPSRFPFRRRQRRRLDEVAPDYLSWSFARDNALHQDLREIAKSFTEVPARSRDRPDKAPALPCEPQDQEEC